MGAADSKNHLSNLLIFLVKHMGLVSTNTNFYQNRFTTDLDQSYFIKKLKRGFSLKIFILSHIYSRDPMENGLLHLFYSYTFCPKINIKEDTDNRKNEKLNKWVFGTKIWLK